MGEKTNKYLIAALLIGILFHGSSIFFTLENTYDALIHLFFADHYSENWFESWNYKWYTGFTVLGYPPLVHQSIAIVSYVGGLKFGLFTVALISIILFITGTYRFSLLLTANRKVAGYTSLIAVFSSSFIETLHIFGQLPTIVGISLLMHTLPEIYLYIKNGRIIYLARAVSLLAVTVTSHHVTPIFGMVFFIFPLLGMVLMDVSRERVGNWGEISIKIFFQSFLKRAKRIVIFGGLALSVIIICILPYWINSKNNPITQIPIPHGSRDNFLEVTSSGLVFFLIPWGIILIILPYIFYRYYSKRYIFFGLSISLLALLGTGGTTPVPEKILGETAFNILTLDRFTLWASIMALPIVGEFAYRFIEGDLKTLIQQKLSPVYHRFMGGILTGILVFVTIFTMSLGYFRPMQPQKIKMLPIVNFLSQDQHYQWRYLTLGFGDQMAWLSSQTDAMTVDGNYHSARRLPELTTRAVERLENSKFRGIEGIGSLQQFLTVPEKYSLKFVFSNDKFYDPILYFCGWHRLQQLENGIMVWEKQNVPPMSKILSRDDVSKWLKIMWGIIPLMTVALAFLLNVQLIWLQALKISILQKPDFYKFGIRYKGFPKKVLYLKYIWAITLTIAIILAIFRFYIKNNDQISPKNVMVAYYDALDFKEFRKAYSFIDPNAGKTLDQYMLEMGVSDGLLNSYSKLDAVEVTINNETRAKAAATVEASYITPVEKFTRKYSHQLIRENNKWYIQPSDLDPDIPPDQLFTENVNRYYNHGRRKITTQQTHHEDILKQPDLEVLDAKLIRNDNSYIIIGEIQNIDNIPADVVIKATLYNDQDIELANYNAKHIIKHKLLPKETTNFRIDFEGIAWLKPEDLAPSTFNPNEFTPVELKDQPTKFNLQCTGNVATTDLYKKVAIADLNIDRGRLSGILFNYGTHEVTVPQLLISYYNSKKELVWVESRYLDEGIRVQRKQRFNIMLTDSLPSAIISNSLENCFVNGLPNKTISEKIISNRIIDHKYYAMQAWPDGYIKIELNNYIGNPIY